MNEILKQIPVLPAQRLSARENFDAMEHGLNGRGNRYNFCLKKSSGLTGKHFYVHDPHTFDETGTRNVARAHFLTPQERAICFANRKRSELSKTEDMAACCFEINRPLRWHVTIGLQEAVTMAKTIGRRNLIMGVLILSKFRLFSKIINDGITKFPVHRSLSLNEAMQQNGIGK